MTEGTTRLLETPERPASFGQDVYEQPGGLAQATSRIPPQANPTNRHLEINPKPKNWMLLGSLLILTIALVIAGLYFLLRTRSTAPVSPPGVTRPEVPPVQPPQLPQPPPPPQGTTQGSSINSKFVYPGAETTMEITDATEGSVLQLQTTDSFDKVVSWYTERLKPPRVIKRPSNVILEGGELTAIINANGETTTIMLTHGDD